jgi:parallel beta-helix repeat protein
MIGARRNKPHDNRARARVQLHLERLEERALPSGGHQTLHVHQGDSIQAAIDAARPGATILIDSGVYAQTVTVGKSDLRIIGLRGSGGEGVVIKNPGGQHTGILVNARGAGVELQNLTIDGFSENDIELLGVHGFEIDHVTATGNGSYGIFPLMCSDGLIEHARASGHKDTGIYVGESRQIEVKECTASGNVIGIEIENSHKVQAVHNAAFGNTTGMLVDLLPGLQITTCADNVLEKNDVHDNNHANFGEPGEIESFLPAGSGILIVGADRTTVRDNQVTGNRFFGVALASDEVLVLFGALPQQALQGIEPNPDGTRIVDNHVVGNGQSSPIPGVPPSDLIWDGTGHHNVWIGNHFHTSFPNHLPTATT